MLNPENPSPPVITVESALILVCDDDNDTRSIVSHALSSLGHRIIEAEDGQVAQDICKETLPDLVVMDVMMPRLTGTEFVKWLRGEKRRRFVPVLLLTAYSDVEHRIEGLGIGADEYVTKPFNYRELQARVQALLRIKVLTEQLYGRTEELEHANAELSRMQEALLQKERELVAVQFAGAAAHSLGQPVTTILLNCHLIDKSLETEGGIERVRQSVKVIKDECSSIEKVLQQLKAVDPHQTRSYVGDVKILDLELGKRK